MGLYNSSDLGKQLSSSNKRGSKIDDPNSQASLKRSVKEEATESEVQPRKRLSDMTLDEQVERAKEKILDFLTYAPRTRSELYEKLEKKGFKEVAIIKALDRLEEVGVVDDAKFAIDWAYSRFHYGNKAPYLINRELSQKGLSEELIENALEPFQSDEVIREKAHELAVSKSRGMRRANQELGPKDTQKIASYLARKGFPPQICFEVAKEVISDIEVEYGDDV